MAKTIYKNSKTMAGLLPKHQSKYLFWWVWLALTSLAIAGIFAILLVLSRAPITEANLPWPSDFFSKGLVAHVTLSFIVWFFKLLIIFVLISYLFFIWVTGFACLLYHLLSIHVMLFTFTFYSSPSDCLNYDASLQHPTPDD